MYIIEKIKKKINKIFNKNKNVKNNLKNITEIINNVKQNKITLEDLKNLKKLNEKDKEVFLQDLKEIVSYNELHNLNKKIIENAEVIIGSNNISFLICQNNKGNIFQELFDLESEKYNFKFNLEDLEINKIPKAIKEHFYSFIEKLNPGYIDYKNYLSSVKIETLNSNIPLQRWLEEQTSEELKTIEKEVLTSSIYSCLNNNNKQFIKNINNLNLEQLKELGNNFSKSGEAQIEQRKLFIKTLDLILNNEQLHELNYKIMENANALMNKNDSVFYCRSSNEKIFQELLLLEAERCGMKAKFDQNKLQPLNVKDIPKEILEHYHVLIKEFYSKEIPESLLNRKIAQSINFVIYKSLYQKTKIYEDEKLKLVKESDYCQVASVNSKFTESLEQKNISEYIEAMCLGEIL